jgi:cation diffusion facilitator family transporter
MSMSGGTKAVIAALAANLGIAATKLVAFVITGSSAMLSETLHSVADSGNQLLLLIGGRRARRAASALHPFGYGRARYIYAFIVSIVLFSVGGLFALYEGYQKVKEGHPLEQAWIAVIVLVIAIVLESFSFRTAIVESNKARRAGQSWVSFVRRAKAPELPVVLLEDFAALIGLVLALLGVVLAVITHDGLWDGIGSICIGVLLVGVAIVLAMETTSLLIGEAATPSAQQAIARALAADPNVKGIIHMRTLHLGPDELLVAAKIAVDHDDTALDVARTIDAAEARIRAVVPIAHLIYLEPDIYRETRDQPATADATPPGSAGS